jgi:hypothetical protein
MQNTNRVMIKINLGCGKMKNKFIPHMNFHNKKSFFLLDIIRFRDIQQWFYKNVSLVYFDDHSEAYLSHTNKQIVSLVNINLECVK